MLQPVPPPKRTLSSWDEAIALLRDRSTDLRLAFDALRQAEAQSRIALAQYLPTINATGTYTHQFGKISPLNSQDAANGNIQAQQEIINAQDFDQISIDKLNEDGSKLSIEDRKRTLALALANQIVSVVTAERAAEINRGGLRVALEQAEITKRKQFLGVANGLDVVRANQNAANARASLVSGDESLREAREALGLAVGIPEETGVAAGIDIDGVAKSAVATCKAVGSIDDRPDIAASRKGLEVAKRNLRNVYLTFLPTINAQSTVSVTSTANTFSPNPQWNIQGVLSIPIWDGGTRYGSLRNARAAEDIAAQQLEAARRQAVIQVQQAQRGLVVAEDTARVAREQRDLAAENDRLTQTAYSVGQGTSLELVTASEAHRQAELNLALQEFGVIKARILAILALATCPW
jgi:outer membrane protein TolC